MQTRDDTMDLQQIATEISTAGGKDIDQAIDLRGSAQARFIRAASEPADKALRQAFDHHEPSAGALRRRSASIVTPARSTSIPSLLPTDSRLRRDDALFNPPPCFGSSQNAGELSPDKHVAVTHAEGSGSEKTTKDSLVDAFLVPSPPRRQLRQRKAAQLAPYTTEMQRYQRRLIRNDWQDAVVVSRELARALKERRRQGEVSGPETDNIAKQGKARSHSVQGVVSGHDQAETDTPDDKRARRRLGDARGTPEDASSSSDMQGSSPLQIGRVSSKKRQRILSESSDGSMSASSAVEMLSGDDGDQGRVSSHDDATCSSDSSRSSTSFIVNDLRARTAMRTSDQGHTGNRDYGKLFRILRRTMPLRMARAYIDDLKAMDHEVDDETSPEAGKKEHDKAKSREEFSSVDSIETTKLHPGQARKRINATLRGSRISFSLEGDPEDDDTTLDSDRAQSRGSTTEMNDPIARRQHDIVMLSSDSDSASSLQPAQESSDEDDEDNLPWWPGQAKKMYTAKPPRIQDWDGIDRMLCRSTATSRKKKAHTRSRGSRSLANHTRALSKVAKASEESRWPGTVSRRSRSGPKPRHRGSKAVADDRSAAPPKTDISSDAALFGRISSSILEEPCITRQKSLQALKEHVYGEKSWFPEARSAARKWPPAQEGLPTIGELCRKPVSGPSAPSKDVDKAARSVAGGQANPVPQAQSAQDSHWESLSGVRLDFDIDFPNIRESLDIAANRTIGELRQCVLRSTEMRSDQSKDEPNTLLVDLTFDESSLVSVIKAFEEQADRIMHDNDAESECNAVDLSMQQAQFRLALLHSSERISLWLSSAANTLTSAVELVERWLDSLDRCATLLAPIPESALLLLWAKMLFAHRMRLELVSRAGLHLAGPDTLADIRDYDALFEEAAKSLTGILLKEGLHRTMASVKSSSPSRAPGEEQRYALGNASVAHWVQLISFLGNSDPYASPVLAPHTSFWSLLEACLRQRTLHGSNTAAVVTAEQTWYTIFAICFLSHLSPYTLASRRTSMLQEAPWSLVAYAISMVQLRHEPEAEQAFSHLALHNRDSYIHVILHRIETLLRRWDWPPTGVYPVLSRIFAAFDAHKLRDLPTERHHDFPDFLRTFNDTELLRGNLAIGKRTSAFQKLLKLLIYSATYKAPGEEIDKLAQEKRAARFLSRFSSMRVMNFTAAAVPSHHERSGLYNAYSFALVYLHVAPSTHQQRLVQMQQCLKISSADFASQIVGIRAMMYTAIVFQHHNLPCDGIFEWFSAYFMRHTAVLEESICASATVPPTGTSRKVQSESLLLTAALRAIQYVLKTNGLDGRRVAAHTLDVRWLDATWTDRLLATQACLHIPSLTSEILEILKAFLLVASPVPTQPSFKTPPAASVDESQDSLMDNMADDIFDNADVMDLAGYNDSSEGIVATKNGDVQDLSSPKMASDTLTRHRELAQLLHTRISPALFQLMLKIFHPNRAEEYSLEHSEAEIDTRNRSRIRNDVAAFYGQIIEQARRTTLAQSLVDCWSRCAWILAAEHKLRPWSTYLHRGSEDPRKIGDCAARQCASTRFLAFILDQAVMSKSGCFGISTFYIEHLAEVWGQLLSSLASPTYALQHLLLHHVSQLESQRVSTQGRDRSAAGPSIGSPHRDLLEGVRIGEWPGTDTPPHPSLTKECQKSITVTILQNLHEMTKIDPKLGPSVVVALSTMLVAMRTFIRAINHGARLHCGEARVSEQSISSLTSTSSRDKIDHMAEYLDYCSQTLARCESHPSETIRRGIAIELRKTAESIRDASAFCGTKAGVSSVTQAKEPAEQP